MPKTKQPKPKWATSELDKRVKTSLKWFADQFLSYVDDLRTYELRLYADGDYSSGQLKIEYLCTEIEKRTNA